MADEAVADTDSVCNIPTILKNKKNNMDNLYQYPT